MTPPRKLRFAAIGECMIELRHRGAALRGDRLELAYGGDTLNTAIYFARLARRPGVGVAYATALGADPYSGEMRAFFANEGLSLDLIETIPGRLPGLYAIHTDRNGERSFHYWRGESAARFMFDGAAGEHLASALAAHDWLYLSGITLSILPQAARARLIGALDRARARGARVVFDGNYRPAGWPDEDAARTAMTEVLARTDLALPTFADERMLFGDADPAATARRLTAFGIGEIVVKNGPAPAFVWADGAGHEIPAYPVARIIDTTAAGDAFNAAYLAARIADTMPDEAARAGHRLAAAVVAMHGAIIPQAAMPNL
ncbi:MAG: sugar kinase [Rhodospirillales bacterium]|nr:sugar kinase [Rhodospirillales bacterium]